MNEAEAEREYSDRISEEFAKERDAWREKWAVSLAVGNGAALLALLNINADPAKRTMDTIVPSYFFLLGLILAAAVRLFQSKKADQSSELYWGLARKAGGKEFGINVDGKELTGADFIQQARNGRSRWMAATFWAETGAAAAFVTGCSVALVMTTIKSVTPPIDQQAHISTKTPLVAHQTSQPRLQAARRMPTPPDLSSSPEP